MRRVKNTSLCDFFLIHAKPYLHVEEEGEEWVNSCSLSGCKLVQQTHIIHRHKVKWQSA